MSIQVLRTVLAERQIQSLRSRDLASFRQFADELRSHGCMALGYRLTGPHPVDGICIKHLVGALRVAVAFITSSEALILAVGPHDRDNPRLDIYTLLYELIGVRPPDGQKRKKPPCCDRDTGLPKELRDELEELVARTRRLLRSRR